MKIDDIEIMDDIIEDIEVDSTNDTEIIEDVEIDSANDIEMIDLDLEIKDTTPEKVVEKIDLTEVVKKDNLMDKTYNLTEVVKQAKEDVTKDEEEEVESEKSALFIGVLFSLFVIFVLSLPYISKIVG